MFSYTVKESCEWNIFKWKKIRTRLAWNRWRLWYQQPKATEYFINTLVTMCVCCSNSSSIHYKSLTIRPVCNYPYSELFAISKMGKRIVSRLLDNSLSLFDQTLFKIVHTSMMRRSFMSYNTNNIGLFCHSYVFIICMKSSVFSPFFCLRFSPYLFFSLYILVVNVEVSSSSHYAAVCFNTHWIFVFQLISNVRTKHEQMKQRASYNRQCMVYEWWKIKRQNKPNVFSERVCLFFSTRVAFYFDIENTVLMLLFWYSSELCRLSHTHTHSLTLFLCSLSMSFPSPAPPFDASV